MLIRKATGEEMLTLWGCEDPGSASPTARFFHAAVSSGKAAFWALDRGGEPVGELYVFYDLADRDLADGRTTAYLCAFRVRKELRGQGYGSRLMETALAELKGRGFIRATIGVGRDDERNLRLYRRLGFSKTVRECHYDPCGMDENMRPLYTPSGTTR